MDSNRPLKFWKLVFAVCFGVLLAASVIGLTYYWTIEVPRENAARAAAEEQLKLDALQSAVAVASAQAVKDEALKSQKAARVERLSSDDEAWWQEQQKLRRSDRSSPCNRLSGRRTSEAIVAFYRCSTFSSQLEKENYVSSQLEKN